VVKCGGGAAAATFVETNVFPSYIRQRTSVMMMMMMMMMMANYDDDCF
jgi:hypothetical protein